MRSVLVVLLILAAGGVAFASAAPASKECLPSLAVDDPKGDTRLYPSGQPFDAPKMDILRYEVEQSNESLNLHLTLAERPGGEQNEYYRYWLGFYFRSPGKEPELVDVRLAFTSTYDEGELVGPNSLGNPGLGKFPTGWNGTTMSFHIPLKTLRDALGESALFGAPTASADGIHRLPVAQGFGPPHVQDDADSPDVFEKEFPALRPCPPLPAVVEAQLPPSRAESPAPAWSFAVLVVACVGMMRPRRL